MEKSAAVLATVEGDDLSPIIPNCDFLGLTPIIPQ
jgi:hypothetical protein